MATRVSLAGRLAVEGDHGAADEVALVGGQARLAFVALVLERHRPLTSDELAGLLWGGELPDTWASGVRNVVGRVRHFLGAAGLVPGDVLRSEGGAYRLVLPPDAVVDVEQAETMVEQAAGDLATGEVPGALDAASGAHAILVEPVLAAVDHPWLDRLRDRLGEAGLRASELEAEARIRAGEAGAALAVAEGVVDAAPLRESAHRLVMRAHEAAGNRGEALRAYERCRRVLADELGITPSPETEATYLALLGVDPEPAADSARRPTGTVTFLFSEIEASAVHWERDPESMTEGLLRHDDLFGAVADDHGGRVFRHTGDGVGAVFATARDALAAAIDAQRRLGAVEWPTDRPLRVRIGLHTGAAAARGDDYAGAALHRATLVAGLGQGGHVLVSASTRRVVEGRLPPAATLRHAGDVRLPGVPLREPVFQLLHPELPAAPPAPWVADVGARASRADDGPLVGRGDEWATVDDALRRARLVTVTGLGGVGKTRLALAVAAGTDVVRPDRVWWADLVGTDAAGVVHVVADVVGGNRPLVGPLDAAVEGLRRAPSLLVLDNCEHVLEAAAELVDTLLGRCPDLRVLATSRVPLGVPGEHVVALLPLVAPADGAEFAAIVGTPAVEVFARRAREASSDFELTPANAAAIADICRRLDGLPLAIELAAARVRSMAPAQIASHLDERFRLLRRPERAATTTRHRSLEDVVAWSYEMLTEAERGAFDRLSVFAGTFGLDAAVAVTAVPADVEGGGTPAALDDLDVLDLLDALVERSMLVAVDEPDRSRYRLLETLREFGRRRLTATGDERSVVGRHRRHHLAVTEAAAVGLQGPDEVVWVRTVSRVLPDLRAAFAGAIAEGDVDGALRLVVGLHDYAFFRMRGEIGLWAIDAVAMPGAAAHSAYAEAAAVAGYLAWERGDLDAATRWTEESARSGEHWLAADALGTIAIFQGQVGPAVDSWRRALELARAEANRYREALTLGQVAFGLVFSGELDGAVDAARAGLEVATASGNPTATAHTRWSLGVALYDREPASALAELEQAVAIARTVDNRMSIGAADVPAEELRTKLGGRSRASDLRSALERVEYWLGAGNTPTLWSTVRRMGRTFAELGEHDRAAIALGAEAAATLKLPLRERERERHDAVVEQVRGALGDERYAAAAARAGGLSPEALFAELRAAVEAVTPG